MNHGGFFGLSGYPSLCPDILLSENKKETDITVNVTCSDNLMKDYLS